MKNKSKFLVFLIVLSVLMAPLAETHAQSLRFRRDTEGRREWNWQEFSEWRRRNDEMREKIDALGDEIVERISIPVSGVRLSAITPDFGDPRDGGARSHEGQDILAQRGTAVLSPTNAVVLRIGEGSSSGKYVYTANPGNETFVYMHLDDFAPGLEEGDVLEEGDLIGHVGNTGNASGGPTHLHFEIHQDREAINPYPRLIDTSSTNQPPASATPSITANPNSNLTRDLKLGMSGDDVRALQKLLNQNGYTVSQTGAGSLGNETNYFGALTQAAISRFQIINGISPTAGYFGPLTRTKMKTLGFIGVWW